MIEQAREQLAQQLRARRQAGSLWEGRLSNSAVSTAVASFALFQCGADARAGLQWLVDHANEDGAWGDSPESPSNMSATLLSYAALFAARELVESEATRERAQVWLDSQLGHRNFLQAILDHYGKDLTFSVPILCMCTLAGMFEGEDAWRRIPRLPFSLAVLPRRFFTLINISVVSYALPALIAVGLLQYRMSGKMSAWKEKVIIPRVLRKLEGMLPVSGGFLEAAPLSGFVSMCLYAAGYSDNKVTRGTRSFLLSNQREEGAWPIDTNLSTWLSSLSIKALAENDLLSDEERASMRKELLARQCLHEHPFTEAAAGGWAWTDLSGGVPDADDSSGALVALHMLGHAYDEQIALGLGWLLDLMNRDGGVPTFCRGWGFLPFDRSCPDISAHALRAFALWQSSAPAAMQQKLQRAMQRIISYLRSVQSPEGAWIPLWFGAQDAPQQQSPVYGTAVVLEHLSALPALAEEDFVQRAVDYLVRARHDDAQWGGAAGMPSNTECTAKTIKALSAYRPDAEATEALAARVLRAPLESSPIGLYFASLWYDEELYPLIFTLSAIAPQK